MKEIVFEAGSVLKKISNRAFDGCTNLKNIQLPDNLETIEINCFWGSGLEAVVLPVSVKEVGADAFHRCK